MDFQTLSERLGSKVTFVDESDRTAKLDLQGPLSAEVLNRLGIPSEVLPKYYHFTRVKLFGADVLLSRTGYTGELGFELYFDAALAVDFWRRLLADSAVKPAGLGARDTLRLEMGYPLYGHELNEMTTPIEAGFGDMLKLDSSNRTFVGSDALRSGIPQKRLIGLVLEGRRAAREGTPVLLNGKKIGAVTSGTFAPSLGCAVAMAYLEAEASRNKAFSLDLQKVVIQAENVPLPFYKKGSARKN